MDRPPASKARRDDAELLGVLGIGPRGSVLLDHGSCGLLKGRNRLDLGALARTRVTAVAEEEPVLARNRPSVRETDGRETTKTDGAPTAR